MHPSAPSTHHINSRARKSSAGALVFFRGPRANISNFPLVSPQPPPPSGDNPDFPARPGAAPKGLGLLDFFFARTLVSARRGRSPSPGLPKSFDSCRRQLTTIGFPKYQRRNLLRCCVLGMQIFAPSERNYRLWRSYCLRGVTLRPRAQTRYGLPDMAYLPDASVRLQICPFQGTNLPLGVIALGKPGNTKYIVYNPNLELCLSATGGRTRFASAFARKIRIKVGGVGQVRHTERALQGSVGQQQRRHQQ